MIKIKKDNKSRILGIAFCVCLGVLSSCEYLEFDESLGYNNPEDMTATFERAEQSLTHVYSSLGAGYTDIDGAMRDCATDDAIYVWTKSSVNKYFNGTWSPKNTVDSKWSNSFNAIRSANFLIQYMEGQEFERFKWNSTYATMQEKMQYWIPEARFLRSFFLFDLARRYGAVAIPTELYTLDNVNAVAPESFDDVISFIVEECDSIIEKLPVTHSTTGGKQTGRATKGAAMALKSRVLLYAASPLFSTDNQTKWKKAALAAKALMDEGIYQLINEENTNNLASKELIFEQRSGSSTFFEQRNFPIGFDGANGGTCPSQNLVDAFERQTDGALITLKADGWYANDIKINSDEAYKDRDPRFYKTIIYNGQTFKGKEIQCFTDGSDGAPLDGASPTGYYIKKYIIEDINLTPVATPQNHYWVYFRYAEVLLNYAEAMNEAYGPDYTDAQFPTSAQSAINQVRARVNMPLIALGLSKEAFRQRVQHERRVELAFENQRFWDVRRWKQAENASQNIMGADIALQTDGTSTYGLKTVENRTWEKKYYFYPVPQSEIYKNGNLKQNPEW